MIKYKISAQYLQNYAYWPNGAKNTGTWGVNITTGTQNILSLLLPGIIQINVTIDLPVLDQKGPNQNICIMFFHPKMKKVAYLIEFGPLRLIGTRPALKI